MITVPLTITITAMLGTFATSAVTNMYGQAIWQPITLLQFLLRENYNASTRTGCFFAGLGFFLSQLAVRLFYYPTLLSRVLALTDVGGVYRSM